MVIDRRTGLLVPPGDAGALASALESLIAAPHLRAELGRSARLRAETAFSLDAHADRLQSLYDRVLRDSSQVP
jgi:glycosyltransferase involved in cell wall biosynthesis